VNTTKLLSQAVSLLRHREREKTCSSRVSPCGLTGGARVSDCAWDNNQKTKQNKTKLSSSPAITQHLERLLFMTKIARASTFPLCCLRKTKSFVDRTTQQ
jgi:hypothetical protein